MTEVSQEVVQEQATVLTPETTPAALTLPPVPSPILAKPSLESPRVDVVDLPESLSEPLKPPLEMQVNSTVVQEVSLGPASQEAAALLLGIGTAVEESVEQKPLDPPASSAADAPSPRPLPNGYPHTPPDEEEPPRAEPIPSEPLAVPAVGPSSPISKPARAPSPTPNAVAGPSRHNRHVNDNGKRPSHWMGEDNDTIRCICGLTEDDGYSIQCETCYAWQHMLCFRIADESLAPEVWYCELCEPRPVDAPWARQMMSKRLDEQHRRQAEEERSAIERKEKPKPRSGKSKRTRLESVSVAETEEKDASPGVMGPPPTKPRKRGPKRTKQSTVESTPGPSARAPMAPLNMDEGFYRAAWKMEYIPIDDLIFRNDRAKRIYHRLLRDHTEDEEDLPIKKRPTPNPSGLPSPTETGVVRLSPDPILPRQSFGILAPPLPLVPLSGASLDDLSSSWEVKPIDYGGSFLPPRYVEEVTFGTFGRPTIYAVYAEEALDIGALVGECTGEVTDTRTYRSDPINQYSGLGLPKPYVRSIGPPVNLLLDARGYGNDLRFVRSGCHPNVVIRPILWRSDDSPTPELRFGLFAAKPIDAGDELVLSWEWDDKHVVHTLNQLVFPSLDMAGSVSDPSYVVDRKIALALGNKYEVVLTHLFSTFSSCACQVPGNCAIAQLRHICESLQKGRHKLVRLEDVGEVTNLGELIGKARGWRLRELEEEDARRRRFPEGFSMAFDLSRAEVEPMDLDSGLNSQWTSPGQSLRTKKSVETLEPAKLPETMDVDVSTRRASTSSFDAPNEILANEPVSPVAVAIEALSAPMIMEDEPGLEPADEGNETDHTSDTEPKTHFTSESESEEPPAAITKPIKASAVVARKARRVLSPVPEAMQVKSEPKSAPAGRRKSSDKVRKGAKGRAAKSSTTTDSSPALVRVPARRRGKRVVSSEDEMEVDTEPVGPVAESMEKPAGDVPEPRALAVDQVTAPLAGAEEAAVAAPDLLDDSTPVVEPKLEEKEPTPPPKEPTPPPEPPKKVSLAEYLKTHKIKKDSVTVAAPTNESDTLKVEAPATPAQETAPLPGATTPAVADPNRRSFLDFLPTSSKTTPVESPRPLATPSASASFVPRSEYFPPQGSTAAPGPSASFAPRASSSFVPRQSSISTDAGSVTPNFATPTSAAPPASSSFAPRPQGTDPSVSPSSSFVPRPEAMPPFPPRSVEQPVASYTPGPSFAPRPSIETPTSAYGQDNAPANFPPFSPYPPRSSSLNPPTGPSLSPQRTFAEMPPALDRRDPPPHAPSVNGYDRKDSLGAGAGGGFAPPPVRAPPTAPRGPKGGPSGANNWPPASPRSAGGGLPLGPGRDGPPVPPPSGPRGFGGGPGFRGRGMGFMRGGGGFRGRGRGM